MLVILSNVGLMFSEALAIFQRDYILKWCLCQCFNVRFCSSTAVYHSGRRCGRGALSPQTVRPTWRDLPQSTRQRCGPPPVVVACSWINRLCIMSNHQEGQFGHNWIAQFFNSLFLTCMRLVYSLDYGMAIATTSSSSEAACGNTCFSYSAHVPAHQLFISGAVRGRAKHLLFFSGHFSSPPASSLVPHCLPTAGSALGLGQV